MKENANVFTEQLTLQFNEGICSSKNAESFKLTNITPAFKQGSRNLKDNYRPISILPIISKIFEKLICKLLSNHFPKGFGAQHYLLLIKDRWKKAVDSNKVFGAILTDLSKAFDCICHDLLVAKLHAYGLSLPALKMIQDYLLNRKQRTNIGSSYSTWEDITSGVPQGSILGPLLFNIFLCDLFLEHENCCYVDFADGTTPYTVANNTAEVLEKLTNIMQRLFTWFAKNQMNANHGKCHLLVSTQEDANIQISNTTINCSRSQKLLGIVFDNKLRFDKHIENICQKANRKLNALAIVTNYMVLPKRRILMNEFFKAQFNYCPVVWMFHSRSLDNKINRLQERCLRIIYNDKRSTFEEFSAKDNSVSVHHNNSHTLAIEIDKVANGILPEITNEVFKLREETHYHLRHITQFLVDPIHSVFNSSESVSYLGPKIWEQIHTDSLGLKKK